MEYIEFGKIINTHGIKGEIKVYSYTDNPNNILKLKKIYIDNIEYMIEKARYNSNVFVIKLKGIDNIESTKDIINKEVYRVINKQELSNSQEFFVKDLMGIKVFDASNVCIGEVQRVINTRANDVYVIKKNNRRRNSTSSNKTSYKTY